jgi:tetratricopeptide (TPR) repeat protein
LEVSYKINDKLTIAEVYRIKGIVNRNKGDYHVAENYLYTSYRLNKEAGNQLNLAETNFELGLLFEQTKDKTKSELHFKEALTYYTKIKAKEELEEINKHLS